MDGQILLFIQEHIRIPGLNSIVVAITSLGNGGWFWIALSVILFAIPKTRRLGVLCLCSMFFMGLLNNMCLKSLVNRTRPFVTFPNLSTLGRLPKDSSFPSGHTAASFAVSLVLLFRTKKRYGIPAVILASLIALSRLYVGVHYPTDVLGGFAMGIVCAFLGIKVGEFFCDRLSERFPSLADPKKNKTESQKESAFENVGERENEN